MAQVKAAPAADADLDQISDYLAREAGAEIAIRYQLLFQDLFKRLAEHPDSGSPRPRLGRGIRIGIVEPYVVAYLHDAVAREVLRVFNGARRITAKMLSGEAR